jgi:transcriptional regulator with GAF, ATPase, and Fis domain
VLARGPVVDVSDALGSPSAAAAEATSESDDHIVTLDESERLHIRRALALVGGKIHGPGGAADILGVNASTLRSRMQKLGIAKLPS